MCQDGILDRVRKFHNEMTTWNLVFAHILTDHTGKKSGKKFKVDRSEFSRGSKDAHVYVDHVHHDRHLKKVAQPLDMN